MKDLLHKIFPWFGLFNDHKDRNNPSDSDLLQFEIQISYRTTFQVKYKCKEGHLKISEYAGDHISVDTLPSRDLAVFINNPHQMKGQTVTLTLSNGDQILKSKECEIPNKETFTPWLKLYP